MRNLRRLRFCDHGRIHNVDKHGDGVLYLSNSCTPWSEGDSGFRNKRSGETLYVLLSFFALD